MLSIWLFLFNQFVIYSCVVEVKINLGTIIGTTETTVLNGKVFYAFYGVPYAQAPIGKLRFKNPVVLKKWNRPFDATTEYHGACAQAHIVHKHGTYGFEDCLHLNIFTPYLPKSGSSNGRPVIVWIHGYAFTSGFSHIHGGDFLIDNDIILVTLTHRIGVFGFLKLNATDNHVNMGLKDIIMGLKWIQRNIEKFGGDKKRVTVMASGSAATFVSLIMMSKFQKLFSKVILQSGSLFSPSLFQGDPTFERNRLENRLVASGFKDLVTSPTNDIITNAAKIYSTINIVNKQRPLIPFMPVDETGAKRYLISKQMLQIPKNFQRIIDVPIMIGYTSQESITEVLPFIHNPQYIKSLRNFKFMVPFSNSCSHKYRSEEFRKIGEEIRKHYFKQGINDESLDNLLKYVSDLHIYPIYKFIQSYLNIIKNKLYVYKFNYNGNFNAAKSTAIGAANKKIEGAAQGDEICYILKCDPLWENYVKLRHDIYNRDRIFITQISEIWASFAKYGRPTLNILNTTWLSMTKDEDNVFLFSKDNKLINSRPERKMFEFWNDLYDKYFSSDSCSGLPNRDEL